MTLPKVTSFKIAEIRQEDLSYRLIAETPALISFVVDQAFMDKEKPAKGGHLVFISKKGSTHSLPTDLRGTHLYDSSYSFHFLPAASCCLEDCIEKYEQLHDPNLDKDA